MLHCFLFVSLILAGTEDDLEYFIKEAGEVLGIHHQLKGENRSSKHVIEHVFKQIVNWKKLSPQNPMDVV